MKLTVRLDGFSGQSFAAALQRLDAEIRDAHARAARNPPPSDAAGTLPPAAAAALPAPPSDATR